MNTGTNDKGERCFNVGAEGSVARIREYYPAMIERLDSLCYSACGERMSMGGAYMDGMAEMVEAGITDQRTRLILMELSAFGDDYIGRERCSYVKDLNF